MTLTTLLPVLSLISLCLTSTVSPDTFEPQKSLGNSKKHELLLNSDLIEFHKNLVEIESISGNEKAVGDFLHKSLIKQGYNAEKQYVSKDPERFNVYAWRGDSRDASVVLSSHIDTVPPFLPYKYTPNKSHPTNATIFGRGSVDAKASVATQIIALNNLLHTNRIPSNSTSLLYVIGEEVGGSGMRHANSLNLTPKTIIFGEPTTNCLVSGHKGIQQISLHAKGKAGHSGYPWLGRSANEILVLALAEVMKLGEKLPKSEKYGSTTFNLGRIEGGVAGNVIAQHASAEIACRIASGSPELIQKEVTSAIRHALDPFLSSDDSLTLGDLIDIDFTGQGYGPVDIDHDVPGFEVMTVNYGTDIPWLEKTREDQKRYLFGPGTIFVAHSAQEEVGEEQLREAVEGYERIILWSLGKGKEEKEDL